MGSHRRCEPSGSRGRAAQRTYSRRDRRSGGPGSPSSRAQLQIREPFLKRNEEGTRRLQERGLADPNLAPAVAVTILGGMVEYFSMLWFVHGVDHDEETAVETHTRPCAQSLRLQKTSF